MRFCEEELLDLAKLPPDLDGVLQFKTQASRIRDQIQGFKSRWFKLKGNFLFYYRINDEGKIRELLGAFLMERFRILLEIKPNYAFSITFQNDRERKYIFTAISNAECQRWVGALKNASYEKLQTQFFLLQQRLVRITGKNPVQRHGLRRYYVDFLTEDGIEMNDDTIETEPHQIETKPDQIETKNTKGIKGNRRHPLAGIQEHRFQLESSLKNNHAENCATESEKRLVAIDNETSPLCDNIKIDVVGGGDENNENATDGGGEDETSSVVNNERKLPLCDDSDKHDVNDIIGDKKAENIKDVTDEVGQDETTVGEGSEKEQSIDQSNTADEPTDGEIKTTENSNLTEIRNGSSDLKLVEEGR